MTTLTRELRRLLGDKVREARRTAEAGARKVIEQLAVHHHEPWPSMTPAQRELRNRLRAHGRQLGDRRDEQRGQQAIERLTSECAYEHWHRLLFARFLAETELLIEPQSGIAITLAECEELARDAGRDWLEVAAEYAQRMLPQIFRNGDPVLEVALPPETRSAIEDLMKALPRDVFVADDSLGWVYQFWQADRKEAINRSENKIGAEELPAVTQLFTEDYMVFFLLHNTLGAWWAGKILATNPTLAATARNEDELRAACAVGEIDWTYLRFVREGDQCWRPAAGTFEGWPKAAKDITLLDPCMGSGHFLVFALTMLAALRAREEGITPEMATLAVLRDNLFGLEIDARCTQIAAFNLALAAWRRVGYRALPTLHLACSGLSPGVNKAEWLRLAERAAAELPIPPKTDLLGTDDNLFSDAMKRGLERIYDLFECGPLLGSLIEPRGAGGDLIEQGLDELQPIVAKILAGANGAELAEIAVAAQGLSKAAQILTGQFTLVATNVPFLGGYKQCPELADYLGETYEEAGGNLANAFLMRLFGFLANGMTVAAVTPQDWMLLGRYENLREIVLSDYTCRALAFLGAHAFETIEGEVVTTSLSVWEKSPFDEQSCPDSLAVDAQIPRTPLEKGRALAKGLTDQKSQLEWIRNPNSRITVESISAAVYLSKYVRPWQGIKTSDDDRFVRCFWEHAAQDRNWCYFLRAMSEKDFSGREHVLLWEEGRGQLRALRRR